MTVREALAAGSATLRSLGIETPQLDASLLLAKVLDMSRSSLIAAAARPLSEQSFVLFNNFLRRRLTGESIAYILGKKEFYGLEFMVTPSVLVPRPDTETLVEAALTKLKQQPVNDQTPRALDLCTGSGAVAIALKHELPDIAVWASDISAEALKVARTNAVRLLPQSSTINFYHGSLFEPFRVSGRSPAPEWLPFHMIISNPPYIPTAGIASLSPEVRREPILALDGGSDGLDLIGRIISHAPEFLCTGGVLLLEADPRQMDNIASLLAEHNFSDIQTRRDLSGRERVIEGIYM